MASPIASAVCINFEAGPGEVNVVLPGGFTISANSSVEWGDLPSIARDVMGKINTALAPLGPFFTLFDVLIAVFDCIKAVKEAISIPPQPQKLAECIVNLQEAVNKLLALHPAVSIPLTVKSVLRVIILFLRGVRAELAQLISFSEQIFASEQRAVELGNFQLQSAVDCSRDQLQFELDNLNESIKPLSRLMSIINLLLQLAGVPCIQIPLDPLSGAVDATLLVALDGAIEFITVVADFIPALTFNVGPIPLASDPC